MDEITDKKTGVDEMFSQLGIFTSQSEHKDVNESVVEFSTYKFEGDDGAVIFISDSRLSEMSLMAYLIPYRKTYYKTRKIIFRPDENGKDMKISLHEIFLKERGGEEVRKRKFRFYVRVEDLDNKFTEQCKKYLLNRISNQDVIKSIKHNKVIGQAL